MFQKGLSVCGAAEFIFLHWSIPLGAFGVALILMLSQGLIGL